MTPLFRRLGERPYLLLTLTSLFWAGNAVVGRAIAGDIPPVALAQIRWTAAFLLVLPFAWRRLTADMTVIRRHLGIILLLSATGVSAFNTMLYWSLQYTTVTNATLMQSSAPLLFGLWSFVLFREPLTRNQIAGILVSLAGVLAIVSGGDPTRLAQFEFNVGDAVMLLAVAVYGIYSTLLRKRPAMNSLSFLCATLGLGALLLAPATVIENMLDPGFAPFSWSVVAALAYIVIFPSILAYLCFNRGVDLVGANRAGPFFHLIPLFGALMAVTFLGERPGLQHGVGAVLIIGGVVLASRRAGYRGKERMASAAPSP